MSNTAATNTHIITPDDLRPFLPGEPPGTFRDTLNAFISHQQSTWPGLQDARSSLDDVLLKTMPLEDLSVQVQHNPNRIKSVSAKVDAASVNSRPCFLCPDQLYPNQKGLPFKDTWLVLNNPFPIFRNHLVITHRNHVPQLIGDDLAAMASFVHDVDFSFLAFYNGPACGASAPDHLHFQACPLDDIPLPGQILDLDRTGATTPLKPLDLNTDGSCYTACLDNRGLFICLTESSDYLCGCMEAAMAHLACKTPDTGEPMVNLIISGSKNRYTGILFPRKAHRPDCFFRDDHTGLLISPGAVDVGGLVIVPRPEDFQKITSGHVLDIFGQVCYGTDIFEDLKI